MCVCVLQVGNSKRCSTFYTIRNSGRKLSDPIVTHKQNAFSVTVIDAFNEYHPSVWWSVERYLFYSFLFKQNSTEVVCGPPHYNRHLSTLTFPNRTKTLMWLPHAILMCLEKWSRDADYNLITHRPQKFGFLQNNSCSFTFAIKCGTPAK